VSPSQFRNRPFRAVVAAVVVTAVAAFSASCTVPPTAAPQGSADVVAAKVDGYDGKIVASGWARDPDTANPTLVRVTANGAVVAETWADQPRPDVAASVAGATATTGFNVEVPATNGLRDVCVWAVDTAGGNRDTKLRCEWVHVVAPGRLHGSLDAVAASVIEERAGVAVSGWAHDSDVTGGGGIGSGKVQVTVNGVERLVDYTRNARPDVTAAFPQAQSPGFNVTILTGPGTHNVCVNAVKIFDPAPPLALGCRSVTVGAAADWRAVMLSKLNTVRAQNGRAPLAACPRLTTAAQDYAKVMADNNHYDHYGPAPGYSTVGSRVTATGYIWATLAENIMRGVPYVDDAHRAWVGSSGHFANMISPNAVHVGFGMVNGYWVQNFGAGGTC
jgi:uncharacterized protein YkwD